MTVRWDQAKVERAVRILVEERMRLAMITLTNEIQTKISRGQPTERSGRTLRGLDPSRPGDPPKVVTGDLRKSVRSDVTSSPTSVVGRAGATTPYARALEFGVFAKISFGPGAGLAPRPYLRPALHENFRRLVNIIGRGR